MHLSLYKGLSETALYFAINKLTVSLFYVLRQKQVILSRHQEKNIPPCGQIAYLPDATAAGLPAVDSALEATSTP